MKTEVSPKQFANAIGVSESSVKRWCDRGLLPTIKTVGGHRRLPVDAIVRFLKETGRELVRPELLGLPAISQLGPRSLVRAVDLLQAALIAGDVESVRRIIFELNFAKHSLAVIFDEVVACAFQRIGEGWSCRQVDVYQERRGCEVMQSVLHELRLTLPTPNQRPVAIGGAPEGDLYELPTKMAELVLVDAGWNATSLGNSLPIASLVKAVQQIRPKIFWLSCSHIAETSSFVRDLKSLFRAVKSIGGTLLLGGQALTNDILIQVESKSYCKSMRQLVERAGTAAEGSIEITGATTK